MNYTDQLFALRPYGGNTMYLGMRPRSGKHPKQIGSDTSNLITVPITPYNNGTDNELNFSSSLKNLQHCIADIRLWMTQNLLILNDNITNIIYLASPHCVKSLRTTALQMGASSITPNGSVKI